MADSRHVDLLDYLSGNLDEAGRRHAEDSLGGSPELRAELADLRNLAAVVNEEAGGRTSSAVPDSTALMAALAGGSTGFEHKGLGSTRRDATRGAFTVLLFVAGLGLLALLLRGGSPAAFEAGFPKPAEPDAVSLMAVDTSPRTSPATAVARRAAPDLRNGVGADFRGRLASRGDGDRKALAAVIEGPDAAALRPQAEIASARDDVIALAPQAAAGPIVAESPEEPEVGGSSAAGPPPDQERDQPSSPPPATPTPRPPQEPTPPIAPATSPPPTATSSVARVTLLVLDPTGAPVAEARVLTYRPDGGSAREMHPVPSEIGRFDIELPAGAWRVYAERPDGRLAGRWLDDAVLPGEGESWLVAAGESITREVVLGASAGAAIVGGRATDASGSPLERALIVAVEEGGQGGAFAAVTLGSEAGVEAAGRFILRLPAGRWRLGLSRDLSGGTEPEWWRLGGPAGVIELAQDEQRYDVDLQIGRLPSALEIAPIAPPGAPSEPDR